VSVFMLAYVCMFTYNSGMGGAIVSKFLGCLRDDFTCKALCVFVAKIWGGGRG